MTTDAQIAGIADGSPLLHHDWPDRGPAPKAYYHGMGLAFARAIAILHSPDDGTADKQAISRATTGQIGDTGHDVLAWYSHELQAAGASADTAEGRLIALFSIMLGLGMRESSGRYCVGADTPEDRGEPTTEANAEAGLFQVSYDSINGDPLRQALFDAYKNRTDLEDVFSVGVNCSASNWMNHGSGAGAKFQETMKNCPLFAVLYTAQFLRGHRQHWGPINHKHAEVRADAVKLFTDILKIL